MKLDKYFRAHIIWAIINFLLCDLCLEYTGVIYPMDPFGHGPPAEYFHPALLPQWLLPYIIVMWLIGHISIQYWRYVSKPLPTQVVQAKTCPRDGAPLMQLDQKGPEKYICTRCAEMYSEEEVS